MRRFGAAVLLAGTALTGCSSFRDVFTSHAETVARVGEHQLKSAHVADIINRVGGPAANPQAAEVVAGIWVDLQLFGDRVARGTLKPDSALFQRLLWPQLASTKSAAWHDTIVAHRPAPTAAAADSVYQAGQFRLFQHILIQPTGTTAADSAKAKAQAEQLLPQARKDFGKTASEHSADQQNKKDKGYLPVSAKGSYVAEFDTVAWKLDPGQQSGVVRSSFGYHIIRRPPLEEVRDRFLAHLKQSNLARQDSVYFAELTRTNEIKVKAGAPAAVRSALSDLGAARKSRKELVSYRNGSFAVADFARWMTGMPSANLAQIRQANDTLITQFLLNLTQNTILLREADSAKISVAPLVYGGLLQQYRASIADLAQAIGLDGPQFADSSKTPLAERLKLAGEKVDAYFEKLTKGEVQFKQPPPTLSAELRATGDYKVYQAGIARAGELILAKRRADSVAGRTGVPQPPAGIQRAPGGPPTPGKKP
ncbi:MAG TPA: peptidylprolyl isomerase [Gemmatimonadales bacterium]|jgi:hypothetical protein|nr:peptidylprolyl isomerase [Gemmatimonadales bacterium]